MDSLLLAMAPKRDPVILLEGWWEASDCRLASETGLCNRLREDGASTVKIENRTVSHLLVFLPYGITDHSVVSPYLQSSSHRLETDWSSGTEPNPMYLSQTFAGMGLMPASLNPFQLFFMNIL